MVPKRILLTGDTVGGVWPFTLELAAGLIHKGNKVSLATFGPPVTEAHIRAAAIEGLRWFHFDSKLEWMEDPWEDIEKARRWLSELARHERPDLVHLNTLCHGDLRWNVPVITTVHSCVSSWWDSVRTSPLPLIWRRYCRQVELSLRSATCLVAPTLAAMQSISRYYDVSLAQGLVIPNARASSEFYTGEKKPIILTAGRVWDEAKNVAALTSVAPILPWTVYVAGETRSPDGYEKLLGGCCSLGQLTTQQLAHWYAQASIYVSLAKYEPFGLAVLEAAMSGCALVLSDIPTLRELWSGAAVFCAVDNQQELEAILQKLIRNPAYRQKVSERALLRSKQFTREKMVQSYLSAYGTAAARHALNWSHACVS